MKDKKIVLGYITCKDTKEAQVLVLALLKQKLIACGNVYESVQSFYHWEQDGKTTLEQSKEAILIVKTSQTLTPSVIKLVKKLHSYTCPCILFYKVIDGNKDYLAWLKHQIKDPPSL